MVEDLGKIKITIEGEGAEQVAQDIADSVGESDEVNFGDGATDNGQGGIGGMLGGISTKLAGILAAVGVLASLKPIQEILSGIFRILSVAILPFVSLLNAILQPILLRLTRFIGELDFDSSFQKFFNGLRVLFDELINDLISSLETWFTSQTTASQQEQQSIGRLLGTVGGSITGPATGALGGQLGAAFGGASQQQRQAAGGFLSNPIEFSINLLGEQSNTASKQNTAETSNKETSDNGAGGLFF